MQSDKESFLSFLACFNAKKINYQVQNSPRFIEKPTHRFKGFKVN
jgi:hypothetical protein